MKHGSFSRCPRRFSRSTARWDTRYGIRSFLRLCAARGRISTSYRGSYSKRSEAFDRDLFGDRPLEGGQRPSGLVAISYLLYRESQGEHYACIFWLLSLRRNFVSGWQRCCSVWESSFCGDLCLPPSPQRDQRSLWPLRHSGVILVGRGKLHQAVGT